jgi:tRNA pseudouridine38-40 synthase
MYKYKIILEYDGTSYRGWQTQKNARSVQETFIAAAEAFLDAPVQVHGAGRTDAGVHALAQVAHLESPQKVHPDVLRMGINDHLPASVNILKAEKAPAIFHARHHALGRSYLYLISRRRTAFGKRYVWWIKDPLDVSQMKQALGILQGFHDFASFADKRMEKETSTKVNIEGIWLKEFDDIIAVRILGSHFLWKMVRRIVGVIVEVGRGHLSPQGVEKMLVTRSEMPARFTAPPSGLFLEKVLYAGDTLPPIKLPVCLF